MEVLIVGTNVFPPRKFSALTPNPFGDWARVLFEKFYLWKIRTGRTYLRSAGRRFMRTSPFQDALIATATSPAGRWARIVGGGVAILAGWRIRRWAGGKLAVAGALAAVPAL